MEVIIPIAQFLGPAILAGLAAWFAAGRNASAVRAAAHMSQETQTNVARLNEQAAVRVAEINAESQLAIARNRMLWEYRTDQVRPLLERANGRLADYTTVETAVRRGDWAKAREMLEPLLTVSSPLRHTDYMGVVDTVFMTAAVRFMQIDTRIAARLDDAIAESDSREWDSISDELNRDLFQALGALGLAAQRYVFEGPDPTPEQWARIVGNMVDQVTSPNLSQLKP